MPSQEADSTDGTAKPRPLAEPEKCPGGAEIKPPFEMGVSDFLRLLEELYQKGIKNCTVQLIDIAITKKMKSLLKLISKENKVTICK